MNDMFSPGSITGSDHEAGGDPEVAHFPGNHIYPAGQFPGVEVNGGLPCGKELGAKPGTALPARSNTAGEPRQ